jgi:hypothetical protein
MSKQMSKEARERARELLRSGIMPPEAQAALAAEGLEFSLPSLRGLRLRLRQAEPDLDAAEEREGKVSLDASVGTLVYVGDEVRTVEDALRKGGIDERVWVVDRCVVNNWEVGMRGPKGEVVKSPLWQVKVWLRRRDEEKVDWEAVAAKTVEQMKGWEVKYDVGRLAAELPSGVGKMLELDVMDLHLGLLSWAPETGVNYDTAIAESRYMQKVEELVQMARPWRFDRVLLPTGNDFLHCDTEQNQTSSQKVTVDVDTRATRVFERGKLLMVRAIERLLLVAPVVQVPIIPGNHDRQSMLHLGHVLAAWFRGVSDRVQIDFSPKLRKYVRWGKNLIGYTHGSEEPLARLPMIMAHEEAGAWAGSRHRVWRVGHKHTRKVMQVAMEEMDGVVVKQCAALASRDAWTTKRGFVTSAPGACATVWDREGGAIVEIAVAMG